MRNKGFSSFFCSITIYGKRSLLTNAYTRMTRIQEYIDLSRMHNFRTISRTACSSLVQSLNQDMFWVFKPSPTPADRPNFHDDLRHLYFFLQRSSAVFGRSALSPVSVSVSYDLGFTVSAFFFFCSARSRCLFAACNLAFFVARFGLHRTCKT